MKRYRIAAAVLILVLTCAFAGCAQQPAGGTAVQTGTEQKSSAVHPREKAYDPAAEKSLGNFMTTDLDGNTVDQNLFRAYDMTMLNVWATYCPTCMEELEGLAELYAANKDRTINIVGIVYDAAKSDGSIDEAQVALAREIVEKTGAAYTQLLPSPDLEEALLNEVTVVPHTIFLNRYGMEIDQPLEGVRDTEQWQELMDKTFRVYYGGCHVKE